MAIGVLRVMKLLGGGSFKVQIAIFTDGKTKDKGSDKTYYKCQQNFEYRAHLYTFSECNKN